MKLTHETLRRKGFAVEELLRLDAAGLIESRDGYVYTLKPASQWPAKFRDLKDKMQQRVGPMKSGHIYEGALTSSARRIALGFGEEYRYNKSLINKAFLSVTLDDWETWMQEMDASPELRAVLQHVSGIPA